MPEKSRRFAGGGSTGQGEKADAAEATFFTAFRVGNRRSPDFQGMASHPKRIIRAASVTDSF